MAWAWLSGWRKCRRTLGRFWTRIRARCQCRIPSWYLRWNFRRRERRWRSSSTGARCTTQFYFRNTTSSIGGRWSEATGPFHSIGAIPISVEDDVRLLYVAASLLVQIVAIERDVNVTRSASPVDGGSEVGIGFVDTFRDAAPLLICSSFRTRLLKGGGGGRWLIIGGTAAAGGIAPATHIGELFAPDFAAGFDLRQGTAARRSEPLDPGPAGVAARRGFAGDRVENFRRTSIARLAQQPAVA